MAEYRLSPAAERDIEGIWDYTVERWGLAQANRYADALFGVFHELANDPHGARSVACDAIRAGYRRRSIERHIVFFRLTEYGVAIIRVLHERMDVSRHLG